MRRLLCLLGFHAWRVIGVIRAEGRGEARGLARRCRDCGARSDDEQPPEGTRERSRRRRRFLGP